MSHSSQETKLSIYREELAQINSEFFLLLDERRKVSVLIQELKKSEVGKYSHYDPEREKVLFNQFRDSLLKLSLKELLAFSLIMEDQANTLAPGAYPSWSRGLHLSDRHHELYEMINPLLLKLTHQSLFQKLELAQDFSFLKDF